MSTAKKVTGTVKWFSSKKGYGFITPADGNSITDDVFVHQSVISSSGYRTLFEGWIVEFELGRDEAGKIKAENVTAPGGGPCTGPRPARYKHSKPATDQIPSSGQSADAAQEPSNREASVRARNFRPPRRRHRFEGPRPEGTLWHHCLSDSVKSSLQTKSIRTSTGTIDIAVGPSRIKLGTRGYSSMARADGVLAEGTFTVGSDGLVNFTWTHAIKFSGDWVPLIDKTDLLSTLSLSDVAVVSVGVNETASTLMGEKLTDPRKALEENGFQMRRIVLTSKKK